MSRSVDDELLEQGHRRADEGTRAALGEIAEALGSRRVGLWLLDAATGSASPVAQVAAPGAEIPAEKSAEWGRLPVDELPVLREVLGARRRLTVHAGQGMLPAELEHDLDIRHFDAFPIVRDGGAIAMLAVDPPGAVDGDLSEAWHDRLASCATELLTLRAAHRRRREAELLIELLDSASGAESLNQLLGDVCERLADYSGATFGAVFMPDGEGVMAPRMARMADGTRSLEMWERFLAASSPELIDDVLDAERAVVVDDRAGTPDPEAWWAEHFGVRSALGVPIGPGDSPTGVMVLASREARRFSEAVTRLAEAAGLHLGEVVERVRLDEERRVRLRVERTRRQLLERAEDVQDAAGAAEVVADVAAASAQAPTVAVALTEGGKVALAAVRAPTAEQRELVEQALRGRDLAEQLPVAEIGGGDPLLLRERMHDTVAADLVDALRAQALACLPLGGRDGLEGVVLCAYPAPRWWRAADRELLASLTREATVALERAQLRAAQAEHVAELAELARRDDLTSLCNRTTFVEALDAALADAGDDELTAVLYLDLQRLKVINDSLGHDLGDALLQMVADRIAEHIECRIGARIGGDEFAVLLRTPGTVDEAVRRAGEIGEHLREPYVLGSQEVFLTLSMGLSITAGGEGTGSELLSDADLAMYRAKRTGRSHPVVARLGEGERERDHSMLEISLRPGVEREEFLVFFQPSLATATGRPASMEALVRWQHPERGLVPPGDFIPLAENTGSIVPIGLWVLEQACAWARRWREQDPDVRVWVNLSARQIEQPSLVDDVVARVRDAGVPPEAVGFELTEHVLVGDAPLAAEVMHDLRGRGFALAIDDFGSGFSSLQYLRQLPVDLLKIDRGFVSTLHEPQGEAIVRSIVELARTLDLQVTGEGVETEQQAAALVGMGCDYLQGFLFARPCEPEAAEELIGRTWSVATEQ